MRTGLFASLAAAVVALCGTTANAAPLDPVYAQYAVGIGSEKCRSWDTSSPDETVLQSPQAQWLLGVVSGNNFFKSVGNPSAFLFYDGPALVENFASYCRANPDAPIYFSAVSFFEADLKQVVKDRASRQN